MKALIGRPFDQWRDCSKRVFELYGNAGDAGAGVFNVPVLSTGTMLHVIASVGDGWDHVSVSRTDRCPTWEEMVYVKRAFFKRNEWAMELHPPEADNISRHPYCLHLWRPHGTDIPIPFSWMVG